MVNVSTAYLPHPVSGRPAHHREIPFIWIMAALAILDIILLFWIFNPTSRPSDSLTARASTPTQQMHVSATSKPSPVGPLVKRAHKR